MYFVQIECNPKTLFPESVRMGKGETNRQFDLKALNKMFTMRLECFTMLPDAVISIEIISHV